MVFFRKWLFTSLASLALVTLVETASAGVIISVAESGSNVVATLSGSLTNLGGGTINVPGTATSNAAFFVQLGGVDTFAASNAGTYGTTSYSASGPTSAWGPATAFTNASSFNLTGTNYFTLSPGGNFVLGPYNFGDPITATLTFNNKTLASIGLTNPASYVYTVGSGTTDTVTFNFGSGGGAAVPEPSSLAVVSIAAAAAAIRARRKAKAKA